MRLVASGPQDGRVPGHAHHVLEHLGAEMSTIQRKFEAKRPAATPAGHFRNRRDLAAGSPRSSVANAVAAILASATVATPLAAQETSAAADVLEQVVVTGSRIPRADIVSNSPVVVVSSEEMQLSAATQVEEFLDHLPQFVGTFGSNSNNPGTGTATVDLRGLGPSRTLVLVNGRRMVPASNDGVVDLNSIPPALVERVEVMTGGASAVYGSDAMAGVVNFILKENYEGVDFNAQYGGATEGDSYRKNFDLTIGSNFADDRGNVVFYANYYDREATYANARPWGATSYVNAVDANGRAYLRALVDEDVNAPLTRLSSPLFETRNTGLNDPFGTPIGSFGIVLTDGGWRARVPADEQSVSFDSTMQLPMERWQMSANGNYKLNDHVRLFAEASYSNIKVTSVLSPVPLPSALIPNFRIDLNNPYMPDDLRDFLTQTMDPTGALNGVVPINLQRSTRELGRRVSADDRNVWRIVTGFDGTLGNGMKWEVFYNHGEQSNSQSQPGGVHLNRFQQVFLTNPADPTQCATPGGPFGGCSVINVFDTGGVTPQVVDFLSVTLLNTFKIQQEQIGASIAGSIFELPAGDLGVALGAEYREESAIFEPDNLYRTAEAVSRSAGLKPAGGSYDVSEIFGEVVVPILADIPGINYLGLEAGIRYSDYSTAGSVTSYKYGGEWGPIEGLRFRGLVQRAVRAPNIIELYRGGDNTAPQANDFCDIAANPTPAEKAFCVELGVPANAIDTFQQESSQIRAIVGGNPNLGEETSDTFTIGFVYQPPQLRNLSVTVDYYSIEIEDAIAIFGGGLAPTITACRQNPTLDNEFCVPLTSRGADGQLRDVPLLNQNIAELKTSGIDFAVNMNFILPGAWGGLKWGLAGVYVMENAYQGSPVVAAIDCAGFVGGGSCTNANPEWRGTQRLTWDRGPMTLSLRHTYIGEVENGRIAGALSTGSPIPNVPVLKLPAQNYFDLSGSWDFNDQYQVYAAIDNLFDKGPPIIGNTDGRGFVNTDSQTYDVIGRFFTIGARARF